jgi:hypothetical protein
MKKVLFTITVSLLFISAMTLRINDLPVDTSTLFSGSGTCVTCHSAAQGVLQDAGGKDVSPHTGWRSTLMANASKDPFWQAKVSTEVNVHPTFQAIIEDKCTTCHAPMGRTEAHYHGQEYYSFDMAISDNLSLDGVSCTVCHQVQPDDLGTEDSFSGAYKISDARIIYGPYENPFINPMINNVAYTPVYGEHIGSSEVCATCHTLFTPYLDDDLNIAGYFPEQTPYLEWLNSKYPDEQVSCQSCHMPAIDETMKISTLPPNLTNTRDRVWEHEFAGGNAYMSTLLRDNAPGLGIHASAAESDSTIQRTLKMLSRAVKLDVEHEIKGNVNSEDQNLTIKVKLQNLSGHKFPTGFPSRRAWIHLKVTDNSGRVVFESGSYDKDGRITGVEEAFQPHYQRITDASQVQIYQALMQDVNHELTYTLLRGASYLKDNRLMPAGYVSGENDTATAAAGVVLEDPDFNRDEDQGEGTGADIVYYEIPLTGSYQGQSYDVSSAANYEAAVCYQSIDPGFTDNLFALQTDLTESFLQLYNASDNTPVIVASGNGGYVNNGVNGNHSEQRFAVFPNPVYETMNLSFNLDVPEKIRITLFGLDGRKICEIDHQYFNHGHNQVQYNLGSEIDPGNYVVVFKGQDSGLHYGFPVIVAE